MSGDVMTWSDYWQVRILGLLLLFVLWPVVKRAFTHPKSGDM